MWGHARVEIIGCLQDQQAALTALQRERGRMQDAESGRADQKNKKWQSEKKRGWVRKRGRDSVCDSTKTALKFHHSFKRYCWISECLFTLSSHEREWWRQKDKHEEETWEQAGKNQSLLLKLSTAFTCFSFSAALLQSLLTLIPITFTVLLTVSIFKI